MFSSLTVTEVTDFGVVFPDGVITGVLLSVWEDWWVPPGDSQEGGEKYADEQIPKRH